MATKFVIIGGGPAGNTAATHAARLGAEVTLIERDIVGGAAHLWDCIPSKTMIATGGAVAFAHRMVGMGLERFDPHLDLEAQRARIGKIETHLHASTVELLDEPGRAPHPGHRPGSRARTRSWSRPRTASRSSSADAVLVSTGSRPRIPEWAEPDGERVLTTRQAYPPPELPEHLVVIGSGVTGVEFVHMFGSFGSKVTLIVSRQQVLPSKDAEVAAALEDELLRRGVSLLKGARAERIGRDDGDVQVYCDDGRVARGIARPAGDRLDPELRRPRARARRGPGRQRAATCRSTTTASPTWPTSTRPGTCRASCRCRRWRRCRGARSPST